jgi:tryptophan 7-halogenase
MTLTKAPTQSAHSHPVNRVVIAGGGTAGWMVAALLSKTLGKILDITLVESDEIGTVGVGEASIPTLQNFHALLEINEQEFMAATHATFKLGINFENWRDHGEDYFHSFGTTGTDHWSAGFQHFWHKGRERKLASDYADYCLELKAAKAQRFAHLPHNGMNYAYHLDATLYAKFLRQFSEKLGVKRREGKIVEVAVHPSRGDITHIKLDSAEEIGGDLFIDCTGFRALLIGEALQVPYQDWSHWLLNDSAVAVQTQSQGDALPYTRSIAHEAGWQWQIPLQHRVGNGLVYSSRHWDDEHAKQTLLKSVQGEALTQPRVIKFKPGQRQQVWKKNCVAIGLSSGFLEPLESTSIHLIQRGIVRLMQLFPTQGVNVADVNEYNQQVRSEIEHIRDFIICHYHVTHRKDSNYWNTCRTMESIPDSLRHRIDMFRETGRVFRGANELFAENSWIQVMLGQGIMPQQHHQAADLMKDAELSRFLQGIKSGIEKTVAQLPSHKNYLDKYCSTAKT